MFQTVSPFLGREGADPSADPVFGAGGTDDDLPVQRHRHEREGLGVRVVSHRLVEDDLAGRVVEGDQVRVQRREVHVVLVGGDAAVDDVAAELRVHVGRKFVFVLPLDHARLTVGRDDAVERRGHVDRAADRDRLAVLALKGSERQVPLGFQILGVVLVDGRLQGVARALVVAAVVEPVHGILVGVQQHVVRHIVRLLLRRRENVDPLGEGGGRQSQAHDRAGGQLDEEMHVVPPVQHLVLKGPDAPVRPRLRGVARVARPSPQPRQSRKARRSVGRTIHRAGGKATGRRRRRAA